jgi:hypothetical protein
MNSWFAIVAVGQQFMLLALLRRTSGNWKASENMADE